MVAEKERELRPHEKGSDVVDNGKFLVATYLPFVHLPCMVGTTSACSTESTADCGFQIFGGGRVEGSG